MTEMTIAQDAPVLVAIDIAKARHEVLIAVPDKKRRRRLTVLNSLAIVGSVMHKVIRPDMVAIFRSQTDARPIIEPEPPFLRWFHWHFKPLTSPKPFDTFVVHLPACVSQQGRYPGPAI